MREKTTPFFPACDPLSSFFFLFLPFRSLFCFTIPILLSAFVTSFSPKVLYLLSPPPPPLAMAPFFGSRALARGASEVYGDSAPAKQQPAAVAAAGRGFARSTGSDSSARTFVKALQSKAEYRYVFFFFFGAWLVCDRMRRPGAGGGGA